MRILLVPAFNSQLTPIFPLGLASLKTSLLPEHQVEIFDPNIETGGLETLGKFINDFQPTIIGLSLRNIDSGQSTEPFSFLKGFLSTLKVVKSSAPSALLIVGGAGFSIFAEKLMQKFPQIDIGVLGEGEVSFKEIISNPENPEKTKGIFFRKGNEVIFTGKPLLTNIETLPLAFRDYRLYDYLNKCGEHVESFYAIGVQTKRGCKYSCAHCTYPYLEGNLVRLKSYDKVMDEIEALTIRNIKTFFISDSVFNYPYEHALNICKEIIKRKLNLSWSAYFRDDLLDERLIKIAEEAGCILFELSPDGLTDQALKILNKGLTLDQIFKTATLLSKCERATVVYNFLRNLPGENLKEKVKGRDTLKRIVDICGEKMDGYYPNLSRIRIYPHTGIYELALKNKIITVSTDLLYPTFL